MYGNYGIQSCQKVYVYKYVDQKRTAAVLAVKKSAGVTPEVKLGNILQAGDEAPKGCVPTLKPRADVIRIPK